ncbi:MAG: STAS domain-containing protein [Candidatus Latescibacterota bacterium]
MLRLTLISQTQEEATLRVEGWITAEAADVLRGEAGDWLRRKDRLVLDLDGVHHIEEAGFALLQSWPRERVALRGGSTFLRHLLRVHGLHADQPQRTAPPARSGTEPPATTREQEGDR